MDTCKRIWQRSCWNLRDGPHCVSSVRSQRRRWGLVAREHWAEDRLGFSPCLVAVVNALSDGIPLDLVQKDAEIIHSSNYNNFSNRNHSSSSFTGNETVSSMRSIQSRTSENNEGHSSSINPFRKASQPNSSVAQSDHEIEYNSGANSTTLNPFRKVPRSENSDGSNTANGHL